MEEAQWSSKSLAMVCDAEGRRYHSVSNMRRAESLRAMLDRGEDLYGDMVRPHLTQFRKDHPEWVLGDGAPCWAATSWNMAIPEVCEYALQRIIEACALADWDGVEIDWQRHALHQPEYDAYRLRYTLTDLMRAVRRMTDEIAARPAVLRAGAGWRHRGDQSPHRLRRGDLDRGRAVRHAGDKRQLRYRS